MSVATLIEHESERLRLVVWDERHILPFAAMNADPDVMRYFLAPQTVEQSRASVDMWRVQFAEQGWSNWAVELKPTGQFIGFIGLSVPRRQLPFSPCVEIGWRLGREFWGRGLATEGARSCLKVAFKSLALEEVVSFTSLMNRPSRAVMERIGMRNTGQDFEHPALPEGHELRPHCLYRVTRGEWEASAA
jgi:RimJ/RimL family protein N-acetyltransferase